MAFGQVSLHRRAGAAIRGAFPVARAVDAVTVVCGEMMPFRDRCDAGARLADQLEKYCAADDAIVLGLPPGGIPIAREVARRLLLPFDVFVVRELSVPGHDELTMGAVASGGIRILNEGVILTLRIDADIIERETARAQAELERRERAFRGHTAGHLDLHDRTVIVVDEGTVGGESIAIAVDAVRECRPRAIVVACPVAPQGTFAALHTIAEEVVCLETPDVVDSISSSYLDLPTLSAEDVRAALGPGAPGVPPPNRAASNGPH
jgi:putative phosphoribosyl transferase